MRIGSPNGTPGTPLIPSISQDNLSFERVISEDIFVSSFEFAPSSPEKLDLGDVSQSFNLNEAAQLINDPVGLNIMQDIATQNAQPLRHGLHVYVFEKTPHTFTLNEAFTALSLGSSVRVKTGIVTQEGSAWSLKTIPEQEGYLRDFGDLDRWWSGEKLLSQS